MLCPRLEAWRLVQLRLKRAWSLLTCGTGWFEEHSRSCGRPNSAQARLELTVEVEISALASLELEIHQVLADLDLGSKIVVENDPR